MNDLTAAVNLARLVIAYERAFAVFFPSAAIEMAELASETCALEGVRYWISPHRDSITCTKCRVTSFNVNDVSNRYCGHCQVFHDDARPTPPARTVSDARKALLVFESMKTDELGLLAAAHRLDMEQATTPEGIVFGAGRLALIATVLARRKA